jgi:Arc/MetJ-type ribon-helix-helix transcriptional regulator
MKLSVSMPDADVRTLDAYVATHPGTTRSSALQEAINLLRGQSLHAQYAAAMDQWSASGQAQDWDAVADVSDSEEGL